MKVRICSAVLVFVMLFSMLALPAAAAGETPYIDHENWREVSDIDEINTMYNNGESFVVMFYDSYSAPGSLMRNLMVKSWMDDYDLTVYGVDPNKFGQYGIPSWVYQKISGLWVTLPVICIAEGGEAYVFEPEDSTESIQKRLYEFLGVEDTGDYGFSTINHLIFDNYSTHYAKYLGNASDVSSSIASKARSVVAGIDNDLDKLAAIYDWVAENIYYNYDMALGIVGRHVSAEETFLYKDSVCEGYANLTKAMCQAVGIPCRVVSGFATGAGSYEGTNAVWGLYKTYLNDGDFDMFFRNAYPYNNHAWNEAFADGRWVILDTTWGSNNNYSPTTGDRTEGEPDRDYFDPDLDRFSETHLFFVKHEEDMSYLKLSNDRLRVTGMLDSEDVSGSTLKIVAAYNARGKMLTCKEIELTGNEFDTILENCGGAVKIKLFTPRRGYVPESVPYIAHIDAAA